MKIVDGSQTPRTSGAELGVSRGGQSQKTRHVENEPATKLQSGAYSVNVSGRAAELARAAPVDGARIDDLRETYASASWKVDAPAVARRLMEEA